MTNPESTEYRLAATGTTLAFASLLLTGCGSNNSERCAVSPIYPGDNFDHIDQQAPFTWESGARIAIPETVAKAGVRYTRVGYQVINSGPNVPQEDWQESRAMSLPPETITIVMGIGQFPVRFSVTYLNKQQRPICSDMPLPWFSAKEPLSDLAKVRYPFYPNISYQFYFAAAPTSNPSTPPLQ